MMEFFKFKCWLPDGGFESIRAAKTAENLGRVLMDSSSSPNKKWFEKWELPVVKVEITVEVE